MAVGVMPARRMSRLSLVQLLLPLAALLIVFRLVPERPVPPQLAGELPKSGSALVVWSGGSLTQLKQVAAKKGCSLVAVQSYQSTESSPVSFTEGAADAENQRFFTVFPDGAIPPQSPLMISCAEPSASVAPSSAR